VSKSNYEELLLQFEETIRKQKSYFNYVCAKQSLGISYDQWLVLEQVMIKQGINQSDISKHVGKEPASISRIIQYLEKKELIVKVHNEKNKRANKIYLTHQGYDISEKISKISADCLQKQFKGIYEREVSLIREILSRVNKNELKYNP
jgi:DNA-binding MarR family transcriptional regulator